MRQPPPKLLRQAVTAVADVMSSEHLSPGRQEGLRLKAKSLTLKIERAMGAKEPEEKIVVWKELNRHAYRQNENKRLHDLGVDNDSADV